MLDSLQKDMIIPLVTGKLPQENFATWDFCHQEYCHQEFYKLLG